MRKQAYWVISLSILVWLGVHSSDSSNYWHASGGFYSPQQYRDHARAQFQLDAIEVVLTPWWRSVKGRRNHFNTTNIQARGTGSGVLCNCVYLTVLMLANPLRHHLLYVRE
jgi:hypothetical protein